MSESKWSTLTDVRNDWNSENVGDKCTLPHKYPYLTFLTNIVF